MVLTLEQLQELQQEAMADDVSIEFERMKLWSPDEARTYFESGGTDAPTEATEAAASSAESSGGRKSVNGPVACCMLHGAWSMLHVACYRRPRTRG